MIDSMTAKHHSVSMEMEWCFFLFYKFFFMLNIFLQENQFWKNIKHEVKDND